MYGSRRDLRHNLFLFFFDGVLFMPAMTLISVSAVIPFYLNRLGASTFQIALAASLATVCNFAGQPVFGYLATKSLVLHRSFGSILLTQRLIFLAFVLSIPLFSGSAFPVWIFLFFWSVFCFFTGCYNVYYTPLVIKLLPPDKRGFIRGMGNAAGSGLGLGAAALIPVILSRVFFPYNFMLIFLLGILLLIADAFVFLLMRQHENFSTNVSMNVIQYLKEIPAAVKNNRPFRSLILTCMFLVAANSMLPYYTLYAIRVFAAAESQIALLAALAVISNIAGYIVTGRAVDRFGPRIISKLAAVTIIAAGGLALFTGSLPFLFAAWILANLGNTGFNQIISLLLGEVCPPLKLPLFVGVYTTISLALSSAVLLLIAPVLESSGFKLVFSVVTVCGILSLLINMFVLRNLSHNPDSL
ncbi:MAG: MFS transporter [Treponema sp.]|nr:MFS transporter [Treponema sp.]